MARILLFTCMTACSLALAACSSSSTDTDRTGASPSGTTAHASTATATTTVTASAASSPPPASSSDATAGSSKPAAGATIPCTPTASTFTVGGKDGASMHVVFVVTARNASRQTCVTQGYPGVALLDARGRQIEQATRTHEGFMGGLSKGSPPRIVLQPGQRASARVEGFTIDEATQKACPQSPAILFTLPDNRDSTRLKVSFPACKGVQVHPMLPGTTGTR